MTEKLYTTVYANGEAVSAQEVKFREPIPPPEVGTIYFKGKFPATLPPVMTKDEIEKLIKPLPNTAEKPPF